MIKTYTEIRYTFFVCVLLTTLNTKSTQERFFTCITVYCAWAYMYTQYGGTAYSN